MFPFSLQNVSANCLDTEHWPLHWNAKGEVMFATNFAKSVPNCHCENSLKDYIGLNFELLWENGSDFFFFSHRLREMNSNERCGGLVRRRGSFLGVLSILSLVLLRSRAFPPTTRGATRPPVWIRLPCATEHTIAIKLTITNLTKMLFSYILVKFSSIPIYFNVALLQL